MCVRSTGKHSRGVGVKETDSSFLSSVLFRGQYFDRCESFIKLSGSFPSRLLLAAASSRSGVNHTPRFRRFKRAPREWRWRKLVSGRTLCSRYSHTCVFTYMLHMSVATGDTLLNPVTASHVCVPKHVRRSRIQEGRVRLFLREIVVRIRLHPPKFLELTHEKKILAT